MPDQYPLILVGVGFLFLVLLIIGEIGRAHV